MAPTFFKDAGSIALGFSASQDHARSVSAVTSGQPSGVRWSGMDDEPRWTPSPEAQAKATEAFLKARAAQEAEVQAYIDSQKGVA